MASLKLFRCYLISFVHLKLTNLDTNIFWSLATWFVVSWFFSGQPLCSCLSFHPHIVGSFAFYFLYIHTFQKKKKKYITKIKGMVSFKKAFPSLFNGRTLKNSLGAKVSCTTSIPSSYYQLTKHHSPHLVLIFSVRFFLLFLQ